MHGAWHIDSGFLERFLGVHAMIIPSLCRFCKRRDDHVCLFLPMYPMNGSHTIPWASTTQETTTMPPSICAALLKAEPALKSNPNACKGTTIFKKSQRLVKGSDGRFTVSNQVIAASGACPSGYYGYYQDHYDWFWPFEVGHYVVFYYPGGLGPYCQLPTASSHICSDPANYHWPVTSMPVSCSDYIGSGSTRHGREDATISIWLAGQQTYGQEIWSDQFRNISYCEWC